MDVHYWNTKRWFAQLPYKPYLSAVLNIKACEEMKHAMIRNGEHASKCILLEGTAMYIKDVWPPFPTTRFLRPDTVLAWYLGSGGISLN